MVVDNVFAFAALPSNGAIPRFVDSRHPVKLTCLTIFISIHDQSAVLFVFWLFMGSIPVDKSCKVDEENFFSLRKIL